MRPVSKSVWIYVFYSYVIAWSCWLVIILGNQYFNVFGSNSIFYWVLMTVGGLGPAIGSFIVYQKDFSKSKNKGFFRDKFLTGLNKKAYLIFIIFSLWRVFMIWLAFGIDRPIEILEVIINLPFLVVLGGLEELGWRGFLQPQFEKSSNYYFSILAVSTIWSVWHIPLWFISGSVQSGLPFALYFLSSIVLTSSFTTLYKYTDSLLLTILSHAWFNGFIGAALYTATDGTQKINLNYWVFVLFGIEFLVSTLLSVYINIKKIQPEILS
jgi:membrane protease YdiL (CAAX protease family)